MFFVVPVEPVRLPPKIRVNQREPLQRVRNDQGFDTLRSFFKFCIPSEVCDAGQNLKKWTGCPKLSTILVKKERFSCFILAKASDN